MSLTLKRLKEVLRYEPETGVFYRLFSIGGTKAGDEKWPEQIDHINGVRSDNRMVNLRSVSRKENGRNQKKPVTNKSGMPGVRWGKVIGKWTSCIVVDRKIICLGSYRHFEDAAAAKKLAEKHYGFHENHGRTT